MTAFLAAAPGGVFSAERAAADGPRTVLDAVKEIESGYAAEDAALNKPVAADVPLDLDFVAVIRLTVRFSPRIRGAYERKLAEEARYDFFIYNREAFSYGASAPFEYNRHHNEDATSLEKVLSPQVFVRKEFYNTARASVSVGYDLTDYQNGHEGNAFVSTTVSVPLFASREALERSNDKIYQQNKVNDARLEYYQQIRDQIAEALYELSWAQNNQYGLAYQEAYRADLEELAGIVGSISGRDTSGDAAKVQATLASARAECRSSANNFENSVEYLRNRIGIPFSTPVKIVPDGFNPFQGESQEELERVAVETDEEIKTLLNSIKNAQLELELARKGKWDTTLNVGASRDFAGSGDQGGDQGYSLLAGVEFTHIDNRISKSLEKIALANIREYKSAIVNRRREIHTNIADAYTSLVVHTAEVSSREANLPKYAEDYRNGIEMYKAGSLSIDSLLQRRKDFLGEQQSIAEARDNVHDSLVTLMSSTGRYERYVANGSMEKQAADGGAGK